MISSREKPSAVRVLVVCPTEYGGQIEHAADTAMACATDPRVQQVVLLSRPGANAYLGVPAMPKLRVVETIPPRRPANSRVVTRALQVLDLAVEHVRVRKLSRLAGPNTILALDSTKYPMPRLLAGHRQQRLALFLHNVKPHHDQASPSFRERVLGSLERGALKGVDRVIVHGCDQLRTARTLVAGDLLAVALPTSTRIDELATQASVPVSVDGDTSVQSAPNAQSGEQVDLNALTAEPYALVLGELRANKGVELAIAAAGLAQVPMLVAGKSESPDLGHALATLAQEAGTVSVVDRFLERQEFNRVLERASVVVLPYTHFDAQSGILAKAVAAGLPIVASDLASLKEQASGHSPSSFADVHDTEAFAAALRHAFDRAVGDDLTHSNPGRQSAGHAEQGPETKDDHSDWDSTVEAVIGTVRSDSGASARGRTPAMYRRSGRSQ